MRSGLSSRDKLVFLASTADSDSDSSLKSCDDNGDESDDFLVRCGVDWKSAVWDGRWRLLLFASSVA